MMQNQIDDICKNVKSAKNKVMQGAEYLNGMLVKNKADIDFEVKSKNSVRPLFSFKKNFNKEIKLLPLIAAALGIMLIITMMSDCHCCDCSKKQNNEE